LLDDAELNKHDESMDGIKQHGRSGNRSGGSSKTRRVQLYEIGPLRLQEHSYKTVKAYVNRANLQHNARIIRGRCQEKVKLCAVVKANGYGHDARLVVSALNGVSVDVFAVSSIEEAEHIYPFVFGKNVLVTCPLFAGIEPSLVKLAQVRGFHVTICSAEALEYLKSVMDTDGQRLKVHLKVDTGMGRLGCVSEQVPSFIEHIKGSDLFELAGIYTHFATADDADMSFTHLQQQVFEEMLNQNGLDRPRGIIRHAANTSATFRMSRSHFDMVRCGIGLYGYTSFDDPQVFEEAGADLRPVLRVEAPVVHIKRLPAGQACGYGRSFRAPHDMVIGVVPVGYADGLFRQLSNRACMRYQGQDLGVIGRISMDLTVIDLTGVNNPAEGMIVTVVDDRPDSCANAAALGRLAGTIPYEILTGIGNRVKRVLTDQR
jgi:alanine racemase